VRTADKAPVRIGVQDLKITKGGIYLPHLALQEPGKE
jgi:hypothetical protein